MTRRVHPLHITAELFYERIKILTGVLLSSHYLYIGNKCTSMLFLLQCFLYCVYSQLKTKTHRMRGPKLKSSPESLKDSINEIDVKTNSRSTFIL